MKREQPPAGAAHRLHGQRRALKAIDTLTSTPLQNTSPLYGFCIKIHIQLELGWILRQNKAESVFKKVFPSCKKQSHAVLTEQSSSTMNMVHFCTCMKEIMVAAIFCRITSNDCCSSKIKLARSSNT